MKVKTVCVYTCNRSEYSRLKSVMTEINKHKGLELNILVGGSHLLERYGMTVRDIENDGFVINGKIETVIEGTSLESMAKSAGLAIIEITTYLSRIKPDLLLVVGDRYDMLPAVITALYLNIPIAHIQGGEKTGSVDEAIRHVVTKYAHLHFPATEKGKDYIVQIGEDPENVIVTGCPTIDIILDIEEMDRKVLFSKPPLPSKSGQASPSWDKEYLLFVQHPITTESDYSGEQMIETLKALKQFEMQTILIYPNLDAGSDDMVTALRRFLLKNNIDFIYCYKHIPIDLFINLLRHAACIVGNSSAGIRESSYFGTPCVNIGTRQKNREHGKNVITVPYECYEIEKAIRKQLDHKKYKPEFIYGDGNAGRMIADILSHNEVNVQK